jgi:hypothetical protein
MRWAASQSHTVARESGSLCSHALTLRAGTIRMGDLLRWAAATMRARSVRDDRSFVISSVVVIVGLLATRPSSLDVHRPRASSEP